MYCCGVYEGLWYIGKGGIILQKGATGGHIVQKRELAAIVGL